MPKSGSEIQKLRQKPDSLKEELSQLTPEELQLVSGGTAADTENQPTPYGLM